MSITTFDPRSGQFLNTLKTLNIALHTGGPSYGPRSFSEFSKIIADKFSLQIDKLLNKSSENKKLCQMLIGSSLDGDPYFNKCLDLFITKSLQSQDNILEFEYVVEKLKKLSVIEGSIANFSSYSSTLEIINIYPLPENTGYAFSFLLRANTGTTHEKGVIVNIWTLRDFVSKTKNKFTITEYEGGGYAYAIAAHHLRYLGIILKPDGSMYSRIRIDDNIFEKKIPEIASTEIVRLMRLGINSSRLLDTTVFDSFMYNSFFSRDILGIPSDNNTNLQSLYTDSFFLENPKLMKFIVWYSAESNYKKNNLLSIPLTKYIRNFINKIDNLSLPDYKNFLSSWKKELQEEAMKSQLIFEHGPKAFINTSPYVATKLLTRSKVSENLGIELA